MENRLSNEENGVYIKEINNITGLHYVLNYTEENIFEVPIFKKWYNNEINKKGKYGLLTFCRKCNFYFYFKEYNHKKIFKCCQDNNSLEKICSYCGKSFEYYFYCCLKRAIKEDINEYFLDVDNDSNIYPFFNSLPIIFQFSLARTIFNILYIHRIKRNDFYDKIFETIIIYFFIIIYELIYYIPYIIIHIIYYIILFKACISKTEKEKIQ